MHFARKSLTWSLLATFSALSLVGQGLHLLPGLGHGPFSEPCSGDLGHRHSSHCSSARAHVHHTHIATKQRLDKAYRYRQPSSERVSLGTCGGPCSICTFFAQGQLIDCPALLPGLARLGYRDPGALPVVVSVNLIRAYSSRAPPAALIV